MSATDPALHSTNHLQSFTQGPGWWPWVSRARIFKHFIDGVADPSNTFALLISAASVYSIGFMEAMLRSVQGHCYRFAFCRRYARAQLLPSIIWLTADPKDMCHKFLDPKSKVSPLIENIACASIRRRIFFLQCLRGVLFGFVGIAQILRCVELFSLEGENYRSRVMKGQEPLIEGVQGRVIRLAGRTSDVTELSLERMGHHIVPVFEEPDLKSVRRLMDRYTHGGILPLGWNIGCNEYGIPRSWNGFEISRDWLLPVAPTRSSKNEREGRKILVIEADSSVGEQSLALGSEQNNDLTISDASQAFRVLTQLAEANGALIPANGDSALRVVLVNLCARSLSGGGNSVSMRQFIERRQLADVLLDAQVPLINAIESWATDSSKSIPTGTAVVSPPLIDGKPGLIFDTTNAEYFATVQTWLSSKWTVLDRYDQRFFGPDGTAATAHQFPRLVYEATTHETVHSAQSLLEAGLVTPDKLGVLLDNAKGVEQMQESGLKVARVCSSELYDDMFAFVRKMATTGAGGLSSAPLHPTELQALVDAKYNKRH